MNIPQAPNYELSLKAALVWAKLLDPAKAGRGKPSKLMQEQGDMLVSQHGYRIKGREAVKSSSSTVAPVQRVKVAVGKQIADLPDMMRGEDLTPIMPNGKPWPLGIKGCCNTCKASLTFCPCPEPIVNLDYNTTGVVTFKRKKVAT